MGALFREGGVLTPEAGSADAPSPPGIVKWHEVVLCDGEWLHMASVSSNLAFESAPH